MEVGVKQIEANEPLKVMKIENTTIKIFMSDFAYKGDEEIERALDRISNIWIDAYINGRVDLEMLEKLGPFEMINIF
ncbi:hypothetical protein RBU61_02950 [Tissierella sp. MB52-C2]|uniref:hypothetical protein n=1 Tax=Tissierella sp. MB52-C2 TaxID=3070999 RepID=UPI00280C1EB6|nr:hypothetical protein [Tissierella sp. MB52-C2]WMM25642.1 hypothetical protein RBU61_02950 [Tissierella sp. MB52-C2]